MLLPLKLLGKAPLVIFACGHAFTAAAADAPASLSTGDAAYDAWAASRFAPEQLLDPAISAPSADPDLDSTPNLGEFFAGSNPLAQDLGPVARLVETNGQFYLRLRRNPAASDLLVHIEESSLLTGWQPLLPEPQMTVESIDGWDWLSFNVPPPPAHSENEHRFWRARIQAPPSEIYDYYVDAIDGSDSNNGLTPETAFATIQQALAATAGDRTKSVGLRRGQRHLPNTGNNVFGVKGLWGAYGSGHMPFVDCSLPVTGAITPHETHPNVYITEITHATEPYYTGSSTLSILNSNGPHFGLWVESAATGLLGEYLVPTYNQPDAVTAAAFVAANPGSLFVQKVGSNEPDVRRETSGSTFRYIFHLADSSDPRTGGTLRYGNYHSTGWTVHPGAFTRGIAFGRNTRKDIHGTANIASIAGELPVFEACATLDPGCHAFVGPSHWRRCLAYSRTPGSNGSGGGWHNYTGLYESRVPTIYDSQIDGFANAVYSHGNSQNPVMQSMTGARLIIRNCLSAFEIPSVSSPAEFSHVALSGAQTLMQGEAHIANFSASMRAIGTSSGIFGRAPAGKIEDGVVVYEPTALAATDRVLARSNITTQTAAENYGTPTIRRVTFADTPRRASLQTSTQQWIPYRIEDSIVGRTVATTNTAATTFLAAATISNSYIGPTTNSTTGGPTFASLAAYQVRVPGAANDVIMYDGGKPVTFATDPLVDPTLTGPAEILGKGMGVDPQIILDLPDKLSHVPTLQSMGLQP